MKRYKRRLSKTMLIVTLALPIMMCVVIIIALAISFIQTWNGSAIQSAVEAAQINAYNSQELIFSLLGVAITVWIGLNIYNALSKEELNELLDKAEEASSITANTYTQVLISKLRLMPADRIENYLASRMQKIERFPINIIEKMILVEDTFNYAYALYTAGVAGQTMKDGLQLVAELAWDVEECEENGIFSRKQHDFLVGYVALRYADLSFYLAQHDNKERQDIIKTHGKNILQQYHTALSELLGVKSISKCQHTSGYSAEDYQALSILANNICGVYTTLIGKDNLQEDDYTIAIAAGKKATELGTEVEPHIRAVFYRNLGVLYEWHKDMGSAIEAYYQAYKLDCKCPKILHCIASWHRKWLCMKYPFIEPKNAINKFCITSGDLAAAQELLEKTAYWYSLELTSNGGTLLGWPFDLPEYVKRLEDCGRTVNDTLVNLIETGAQCYLKLPKGKDDYEQWKKCATKAVASAFTTQ